MDDFYEQLQKIVDEVPRHDVLLVQRVIGMQKYVKNKSARRVSMAGERSDNGERMVSFCALNNLAIASTMFIGTHELLQMANTTTKSIIWLFAEMLNDHFKMLQQIALATIIW